MSSRGIRTYEGGTAIITGGASGIGRALAEKLAGEGCEVVLADLQLELAEAVAAGIRSRGGKAQAQLLDVTDFSAVKSLVDETVDRTGRLDYMFNNAGIGIAGLVSDYEIEDWHKIIDVNNNGVVNGVQAAYPVMLRQKFGHLVNVASMAGLTPNAGMASYVMTKHAVVGLTLSLRIEAAVEGVRASVICPGVIRTPILEGGKYGKQLREYPQEEMRKMWEMLRPMPPEVFAEKALKEVARNRPIIIVPAWWKLFWWLNRLSPAAGLFLAQRAFSEHLKKFGPS